MYRIQRLGQFFSLYTTACALCNKNIYDLVHLESLYDSVEKKELVRLHYRKGPISVMVRVAYL